MPNRDIDDVTWQRLQKWAIPLGDDLDAVLCRILDVAEEHLLCDTSQPHPLSLKPGFLKVEARLVPENAPLDNGKTVDQLDGILPDQLLHELDRNDLLSFCNGLDGQYLMTSGRGVKFRFEFSPRHFFILPFPPVLEGLNKLVIFGRLSIISNRPARFALPIIRASAAMLHTH